MTKIPSGWARKYELNEIKFRVYDNYGVELSLRHYLVTCRTCTRLWSALDQKKTFRASWWLCPEGCNQTVQP